MTNEWIENTGEVPEGVTAATAIEVELGDGFTEVWVAGDIPSNNNSYLWRLEGDELDIISWRFV